MARSPHYEQAFRLITELTQRLVGEGVDHDEIHRQVQASRPAWARNRMRYSSTAWRLARRDVFTAYGVYTLKERRRDQRLLDELPIIRAIRENEG